MKKSAFVILILIFILVLYGELYYSENIIYWYNTLKKWMNTGSSENMFNRDIGTNTDLLLNGYFGIFLRYKMFGTLNWLAAPLLIYFLTKITKKERWEKALVFAISAAIIIISFQGYMNFRYQLTVYPLLLSLTLIFIWQIVRGQKMVIQIATSIIVGTLLLINLHFSWNKYAYYYNSAIGNGLHGERFPYKLIDYINKYVGDKDVILELNQPILYYHSDKKGMHYDIEHARILGRRGTTLEESFFMLKDRLKINYLLLRGILKGRLNDIIQIGGDLVCEDQGYILYKLKEKPNNPTISDFEKETPEFETTFQNWVGSNEISIQDLNNALFPMDVLGIRGDFSAEKVADMNGNKIRVKLKKANFNERPEIIIGYFAQPVKLDLKLDAGDIVNFIAKVRANGNKNVRLFIQDKADYWSNESQYSEVGKWKELLVRKRIREGYSEVCFGIEWNPNSEEDWLEVSSIRIYIEKPVASLN